MLYNLSGKFMVYQENIKTIVISGERVNALTFDELLLK
jgi:hypothetical protein